MASNLFRKDSDSESDKEITPHDFFGGLHKMNLVAIIENICQHLNYSSIANMRLVCKSWNLILANVDIWRVLLLKRLRNDQSFEKTARLCNWTSKILSEDDCHFDRQFIYFATTEGYHLDDQ